MGRGAPPEAPAPGSPPGPEPRLGWLLTAAWLVFLVFPLADAVTTEAPAPARVATVVVLLVFGGVYATSGLNLAGVPALGSPWARLAVLSALTAAVVPVVGTGVLSLFPFLLSFVVLVLPRPWSWVTAGVGLAVAAAIPLATGTLDQWIYLELIILSVAGGASAGRILSDHAREYALVQDELTVAAERNRVARDVHDVLGHSLTVVAVKAELAARLVPLDPDRAISELDDIRALSRQALAELRSTVSGLRTTSLQVELATAADALGSAGIAADLPDGADVLDPRHRPVAAWVVREAVTNVIRHSGARRCQVVLESDLVRVADDGRGGADPAAGRGLHGLRERVELAGGILEVGPGPAGGTAVEVRW